MRCLGLAALALPMLPALLAACAGGPRVDESQCRFVRHQGMCEASVTLDPRESESPDEAATLIVRWEWLGPTSPGAPEVEDVPDRIVETHLTAREARALAESIDDLGKSRCVVEQAVEPPACVGRARIAVVEAEP